MSRRTLAILAILLAVLLAGGTFIRWYNSPDRKIRRQLDRIQRLIAKAPGESNLTGLGKARAVTELFSDPFEFIAEHYQFETRDRQRLAAGVHQYRSAAQTIAMQISDLELHVDLGSRRATSHLTADFITSARDLTGREAYRFQVNWIERQQEWLIDYVLLLEVIEEPQHPWIP